MEQTLEIDESEAVTNPRTVIMDEEYDPSRPYEPFEQPPYEDDEGSDNIVEEVEVEEVEVPDDAASVSDDEEGGESIIEEDGDEIIMWKELPVVELQKNLPKVRENVVAIRKNDDLFVPTKEKTKYCVSVV